MVDSSGSNLEDVEETAPRDIMVMIDRGKSWVEYVRELSGVHEDPESDPSYWACNKHPTKLSMSDFTKLRDKYRVPEGVRLIFPTKSDRHCNPPKGHVAVMSDAFDCGMRLALYLFFRAIL
ncbi:hypothetical protein Fot_14495 [Forsythia ovata]|uniref:Uncharacterized protein n=1 Tax=Forsythia ovata TaxID=205694 RepID=A0ABD1W6H0_9LAMI